MKAIQIVKHGAPELAFKQVEVEKPVFKSNDVLIKVEGFGLNFADVMARKGLYKEAPEPPFIPGYDVVGKVIEVGEKVNRQWIGKRVIGMTRFGGYAEYAKTNALAIAEVPEDMPLSQALTVGTQYATAYYAMEEVQKLRKGDKVLVHSGAGGVGLALIDIAKFKGLEVFATAGSNEKVEKLTSLGVQAINYSTQNYVEVIENLIGENQIKATFNAVGGKSFKQDLSLLKPGGVVMLYGASSRTKDGKGILPTLKLLWQFGLLIPIALMMKSVSVAGINMLKIADDNPAFIQNLLKEIIAKVSSKELQPYEGKVYEVAQINEAHLALENRQSVGKIAVKW